ncbi:MAG: FecR domain-containing protein [Parashewanella sp.]
MSRTMHTATANAKTPKPTHQQLQQAALWFVVVNDENQTESEHQQWQAWLAENPQHQQAWQYVENISGRFAKAQNDQFANTSQTITSIREQRLSRRRLLQAGGMLCMAWLGLRFTRIPQLAEHYVNRFNADRFTGVGEVAEVQLQDGGKLWLNTDSAINVNYTKSARVIELLQGEIYIETAKDKKQRPFKIETSMATLTVLGTQFTVREYEHRQLLAVFEGAVEIQIRNGDKQVISAGQQSYFTQDSIDTPTKVSPEHSAWHKNILLADNISLKQLVTELGRYRLGYLGVEPDIEHIKVIGAFPTQQPELALQLLQDSLPIRITQISPWWVNISSKNLSK